MDHAIGGLLQEVPDLLEVLGPAGIRIRDLPVGPRPGPVQQQRGPAAGTGIGGERLQLAQVGAVGAQQPVEAIEIARVHLAPAQARDVDAVVGGRPDRAWVGRAADVPGTHAGGVQLDPARQAFPLDAFAQHALGHRRAADVAQADEQQPHWLSHWPRSAPPRGRGLPACPRPEGTAPG